MPSTKQIRTKIKVIHNTRKITHAMQLISASKMRRAQEQMSLSKPYAESIYTVIGHLARSQSEYRHPFLIQRPLHRVGCIVVSTDRGLCGGFNLNVFKRLIQAIKSWQADQIDLSFCLIGRKAAAFFKRMGGSVIAAVEHLGDKPKPEDLFGLVQVALDQYRAGALDAVYVVYNQFINTMVQKPVMKQILPLPPIEWSADDTRQNSHWDYIYEPEAKWLLDRLLSRYIDVQIYQAVVENIAGEQASRMIAMQNATDNAKQLAARCQLIYNKARQAIITQEIAEIVGGSEAVGSMA